MDMMLKSKDYKKGVALIRARQIALEQAIYTQKGKLQDLKLERCRLDEAWRKVQAGVLVDNKLF